MTKSIRSRTLAIVLGLLGVSLAGISWMSYRDAQHEIEELFDAQMAQTARLLEGLVSRDLPPATRDALQAALNQAVGTHGEAVTGHRYESKLAFQVYDRDDGLILQSASAPPQLLDGLHAHRREDSPAPAATRVVQPLRAFDISPGYHEVPVGSHRWRVFALRDARDDFLIVVGERDDVRGELVDKIALQNLVPDLVGLPLVALLVWLAIGWSLEPLKRMAALIKARDPDTLAPLVIAGLPQELEPMAAALNRLLQQLNTLLDREKRFLADAAHELRTPLAVLRIHAQNAVEAPEAADRADALRQLQHGVDRATRLVTQLLTLARLEPNAARLAPRALDLHAFVQHELAELIPLALARAIELSLAADDAGDYRIDADATNLAILLQNLVGNAIQFTPDGGQVRVRLDASADDVVLSVEDSGPGVADDVRHRLFERFYRGGTGTGAGLGLSIVRRIVDLHHASIALERATLGGLDVRVRLPRRSPTP